jgi:membrane peptidoglycan carboxypeptidase
MLPGEARRRRLAPLLGFTALALLTAAAAALGLGLWLTPPVDDFRQRLLTVYREHGVHPVGLDRVPDNFSAGLIAIEDERFYQHHGIDTQGLMRALLADLYHRRALEGASTLSQQLIKNLYLDGDDDGWRKPEDLLLSLKLEARYSKQEILVAYLNSVYYGHGAWGLHQAARTYFHLRPDQLDLAQSAMLAGMPQAPSYYDLYKNPCAARARQYAVLAQMVHDGYISAASARSAYAEKLGFPCT